MHEIGRWLDDVIGALEAGDAEGGMAVVRALGGDPDATVELIEADLSVGEALDYATVLRELGDRVRARELVRACVMSALGMVAARPQVVPLATHLEAVA